MLMSDISFFENHVISYAESHDNLQSLLEYEKINIPGMQF